MNPVVGLDVVKGESQIQMFLDKKMLWLYTCKIEIVHFINKFYNYLRPVSMMDYGSFVEIPI
ncbi:hypothetical protein ACQKND_22420 [Viridibacillus arvi]|uniref:hypothetical protein n=1 Tax=Viridibacillus arvi TaxID=263475 RepID=UPI003CFC0240